ncbi:MAG: glycosyltransferase [Anaerolineales bacterium]|nr:glycosyltransferase [Anaerolineales bacterium]
MRILIPNHFPLEGSGSGIYTQNIARELVNKGHKALVITPGHWEQTGYPFEVRTILFSPSSNKHEGKDRLPFNFPCFTTHPLSTTTFADLDEDQRDAYVYAFQNTIDDAATSWNPDVIHAQHLWVTAYAAHQTGLPYVVTAHGTDLMGYKKYGAYKDIALDGAQNAFAVIAVSRQVAQDTHRLYQLPEKRIRLVWNGFNEEIFHVAPVDRTEVLSSMGVSNGCDVLISFVGKLTEFKGVDVLLNAAAHYEKELGDVMTLIVGDGELRDDLEKQRDDLRLRNVHFLGHQPQPIVAKIYNAAHISIVPSRVEPFGLVAVEALACGTPVVATNEGGLPDFVDDRVGALVDVDDVSGLASTIIHEINTDSKSKKGSYAAEYALENFSWSGQVDRMLEIYNEALASMS